MTKSSSFAHEKSQPMFEIECVIQKKWQQECIQHQQQLYLSKPHGCRCLLSRRRTAVTPSRLHRNSLLSFPHSSPSLPRVQITTVAPARRRSKLGANEAESGERERRRRKGKAPMDEQAAPARQTLSSCLSHLLSVKQRIELTPNLVERLELRWFSWIGWLL